MKAAVWLLCWPLMGVLWFSATGADMLCAAVEGLGSAIDRLLDFVEDA